MSIKVVIRSCGERTLPWCKASVLAQLKESDLHIIEEVPFAKALEKTYEIGIDSKSEYLVTVDADVVLAEDTVALLVSEMENTPTSICQLEGVVFDKLTNQWRQAGHRIYRVKYLNKALEILKNTLDSPIRPEYNVLSNMSTQGFHSRRTEIQAGCHDFEQYYSDIFRKAFVHAHKHLEMAHQYIPLWKSQQDADPDYMIAKAGFLTAIDTNINPKIDKNFLDDNFQTILEKYSLKEKKPLSAESYSKEFVNEYLKAQPFKLPYHQFYDKNEPVKQKFGVLSKKRGSAQAIKSLVSSGLKRII